MLRRLLFVPILLAAAAVGVLLTLLGPAPEAQPAVETVPVVSVLEARPGPYRVTVSAEGSVSPARRTSVTAEVGGRIAWAADALREGRRVEAGAALFRIEPLPYEQGVSEARGRLAQAKLQLATEEAAAGLARSEWEAEGEAPDPLALRIPQLEAAAAAVAAAEAALRRAERDLERTEVRAPAVGLVVRRAAEVGEWTVPGTPLLELSSLEVAEVRIALPDAAVGLVELPFAGAPVEAQPRVRLSAVLGPELAPVEWSWEGRLARMGAELEPATRRLPAVVEVSDPYGRGRGSGPPLVGGMFVRAEIEGREFPDVVPVPARAFREDGSLVLVDPEDRLRIQEVGVLWSTGEDEVLVRSGLAAGDRVVLDPPRIVADGMRVEVAAPGGGR